jgi:hypothetical protein
LAGSPQSTRQFIRARKDRVEELLKTLVALGQAREISAGQYLFS